MCVTVSMGLLFSQVHAYVFASNYMTFGDDVSCSSSCKRTPHASSLCDVCDAFCCLSSLPLSVCKWNTLVNQILRYLYFWGELKWIKNRILLNFIAGPKIQGRGHSLTNQFRIITYLFWSLNIFLLISF